MLNSSDRFPSLSIASISCLDNSISPAATYPLIRDSVWEVVIGTTLFISLLLRDIRERMRQHTPLPLTKQAGPGQVPLLSL
jgi:hypothetical protein